MPRSCSIHDDPKTCVWKVCPTCSGRGHQTLHGRSYTADEMAELGPEFVEDYMAGVYDHPCDTCGGRTTVCREWYEMARELDAEYRAEQRLLGGW